MKVKVINKSGYPLPMYETEGSAGCDLRAVMEHPLELLPLERCKVSTGIALAIPKGYEGCVRPRSGLTTKFGVVAMYGTIDSDYRGEVGVTLVNLSNVPYTVQPGERVAQLVFSKVEQAEWEPTEELDETKRGTKGFGSTGML